jgi:hypothetical protein
MIPQNPREGNPMKFKYILSLLLIILISVTLSLTAYAIDSDGDGIDDGEDSGGTWSLAKQGYRFSLVLEK